MLVNGRVPGHVLEVEALANAAIVGAALVKMCGGLLKGQRTRVRAVSLLLS